MIKSLYEAIQLVSNTAIETNADSTKFPQDWLFHDRWSKGKRKHKTFEGRNVKFETVGGRTSALIESVQKLL